MIKTKNNLLFILINHMKSNERKAEYDHLKIEKKWSSATVTAGTYRDIRNKQWIINLYGGLARHPLITEDAYALVICHEIGHHIGGAPKKIID